MNVFRCYTRSELHDFMLGKLEVQKADEIAEHLKQCHTCEDTVVGLEKSSDTLVNLLAGVPADSAPADYENNPDYDRAAVAAQQVINSWVSHAESMPDRVSDHKIIGDYEIVQTLARGGMGSVFRARHMRLEKEVAIKILPERKMQNPDAIARFSREMKIIGQMSHSSMVAATDAGAVNGIHYLVMELVEGVDLGKLVRRCGPLKVADACELIRQSALGIQYAHDQDVIHRDVKPSNLMLASDSMVKVLDLGLATLGGLTGTVDELTTVGQLMGTLDYMAPEQCGNSQPVDTGCDVYGLGATLYKLIAGVAPYSSPENDTPLKKLRAMATCEPTPIDERVEGLPAELVSIINRCLADLPEDRFDSAADLAAALQPLCADHDLPDLLSRSSAVADESNYPTTLPNSNSKSATIHRPLRETSNSKPKTSSGRNGGRWMPTAIALLLAGSALLGGIMIYLNTTAGQLIVESEVQDVRVTVMKNDTPTKDVQVEQGRGSTKLRAGQYQIVIDGDSDELSIDNDNFVLRKGETVVARITRKAGKILEADSENSPSTGASTKNALIQKMEVRLYELKKKREWAFSSGQVDRADLNHPAVVAYDELIAETKKKLEGEPIHEPLYEEKLFDLRKRRAESLFKTSNVTEAVDGLIKAHHEFMKEREQASKVRNSLTGAESPPRKEAPVGEAKSATAKLAANDPTYNGKRIEYWIERCIGGVTMSGTGKSSRDRHLKIIQELSSLLRPQRKKEIVESQIDKYRHEVSETVQTGIAVSLAPLCETDELFDKLFDHVNSRTDPSGLESSSPIRFQAKLIEELKSEDPQRQAKSIQWAETRARERNSDLQLVPQWKDALLKRIGNVENQPKILTILMARFPSDPEVIDVVYSCVSSNEHVSTNLQGFWSLLQAKPNDATIPLKATQLLKAGLVDPNAFVDLALGRAYEENDQRLFDQLNQLLLDSSWRLDKVYDPFENGDRSIGVNSGRLRAGASATRVKRASGDDEYEVETGQVRMLSTLPRVQLVDGIAARASRNSRLRKFPEFDKKLLPALYKQFELKFHDETETGTKLLHSSANNAIAEITGVKASNLRNGYDIKHWAEKFVAAKSDSEKLQAIQNVFALRNSPKIPDDLALSIAKGVRGLSFDYVDFVVDPKLSRREDDYLRITAGKSVQALAIELFWSETKPASPRSRVRPGHIPRNRAMLKHFVDSLNQLADEDAMFALWVLKRAPSGNLEAFSYIRLYQGSNNPLLQVRANVHRFRHDSGGQESHLSRSEKLRLVVSNLEEESLSTLQRLMILASVRTPLNWDQSDDVFFKLVNEIDDPRQLATLFSLKRTEGEHQLEIIALDLIAKNPDYLHEVHDQLSLNCWISPKERVQHSNNSRQTLLDLCLAELDKLKEGFNAERLFLLHRETSDKAIENLKSIKTNATDIQRNRIDRILKLLGRR